MSKTMKIFFMRNINLSDLENDVNDFIKDKSVYDIKFESMPLNTYIVTTVMIRYEEEDPVERDISAKIDDAYLECL